MPKSGDLFYPAYQASRFASILSGYVVTGVVAAPFVFVDWLVRSCWHCLGLDDDDNEDGQLIDEARTKKQKALYAYDLPFLFSEVDIQKGSHRIYGCSFFGKKTYGLVATIAGVATSFATSLATFAIAASITIAVAAAAVSVLCVVGVLAALLGGLVLGIKRLRSGATETVQSVANFAKCFV